VILRTDGTVQYNMGLKELLSVIHGAMCYYHGYGYQQGKEGREGRAIGRISRMFG